MNIFLQINELKSVKKEININYQDKFYDEWIWNMNYNEWKNIDNNDENYILYIYIDKNCILNKDISKIVNGLNFAFNVTIPTPNNNQISFSVIITPIFPNGKKFVANELKEIINIKRTFPAFNGKSAYIKK